MAHGPLLRCQLVALADDEHALLLTLHHIASDGWSIGVMVGEFVALYAGQGLPALPVQYADYAAWQRERLQGEALEAQLGYWRTQLAGAPAVHGLPLDRPRPPRQAFTAGRVERRLDRGTLAGLQALAHTHEASLFMVLQAAFAALLSRYSGESDIVVGTPVAGRLHPDVEPLIGFFVNTLVLRTRVDAGASFASLVDHVRATALAAYEHQEVPFEMLVEELQPPRHLAHSPLFQVLFALRNNAESSLEIPGLEVSQLTHDADDQARFDLQLFITESPRGMHMAWIYANSLFEHETIGRLAEAYGEILACVARDAATLVGELPVLQPFDSERLIRWNQTAHAYPDKARIENLFRLRANERPHAVALVHGEQRMAYRELDHASSRVAAALAARSIGSGSRVGLCMARSFDMVVGLLGILRSGAAYVPMDPALPAARLAFITGDSKPCLILSHGYAIDALNGIETPIFDIATFGEEGRQEDAKGSPDDAAVVLYTSGSTGQPKGVCVPHRTIVNLMTAMARRHALLRDDAPTLQFATVNFDMSLYEMAGALFTGSPLVLLDEHQRLDMEALLGILKRERVGRIYLPTAMLAPFIAAAGQAGVDLPQLKLIQVAGEALLVTDAVRSWCARQQCALLNLYGPTESHVVSDWMLDGNPDDWPAVPPIGRPIDNVRLHVLDPFGNDTPVGVPGELHIAGAGLALGYLHAPERTAERFIERAGERLYRTGDICRWRGDGVLEYLGRSDFQVKIRGFRVEPSELEAALVAVDEVAEAIVIAGDAPAGGKELRAYVVPHPDRPIEPVPLRSALAATLPEYMLPASITVMDAFPLNANGKVDRGRLPEPPRGEGRPYIEPEGPAEKAIATAWARLFGIARVGRHDHFFELGGHSILAIRMLSMLDSRVVGRLQVRDLFLAPTVSGLAALGFAESTASAWRPLTPGGQRADLPVVYAIPGAGATPTAFKPLDIALHGRATIRAFEHRGMVANSSQLFAFDDIIEENLAALRGEQPHGPYTLVGHSFGGAVAFDMACSLEAQDEEVTLVLLDSIVYHPPGVAEPKGRRSLSHFRHRLPALSAEHPCDVAFLNAFRTYLAGEGLLADPADDDILDRYLTMVDQQLAWFAEFHPRRFGGAVHAFVAADGRIAARGTDDLLAHYGRCLLEAPVITAVPGDHYSMLLSPNATALADHLATSGIFARDVVGLASP
ncbi:MAG: non-ribosomal peptide synthetase [Rhodanobacter sp.]